MPIELLTNEDVLQSVEQGGTKPVSADAVLAALEEIEPAGKVELVYNGTDIRYDGELVNFQQIVDLITEDSRFTYLVYNSRVLLTSDMSTSGGTKYVFFETSTTDGGVSKNAVVKVYSSNGVDISSIGYSTTANENVNNKVNEITERNKTSESSYPSNKAVSEAIDKGVSEIGDTKVDKVEGKGLSSNDYSNEDKAKVEEAVTSEDAGEFGDVSSPEFLELEEEISTVKEDLNKIKTEIPVEHSIETVNYTPVKNNKYWNCETDKAILADLSGNYSAIEAIDIENVASVNVRGRTNSSAKQRFVVVADSNYNIIWKSDAVSSMDFLNVDVPVTSNMKYLLITTYGIDGTTVDVTMVKADNYKKIASVDAVDALNNAVFNTSVFTDYLWRNGGITNSGDVNDNTTRAITTEIKRYGSEITIAVDTDYKFRIAYYSGSPCNNSTFIKFSEWFTGRETIEKHPYFKLLVGKINDSDISDTSEVAENVKISVVTSKIEKISTIENAIFANTEREDYQWRNGGIDTSGNTTTSVNRMRTTEIKNNYDNETISADAGYKYRIVYYNSSPCNSSSYVKMSTWTQTSGQIENYPFFKILFGKNDDTDIINVDDYANKLKIHSNVNKIEKIENDVDNIKSNLIGLNVAIIGDSISTNGNDGMNKNVPEITIESADVGKILSAYLTYYDVQSGLTIAGHTYTSAEIGTEVTFVPTINDVGKTIGIPNNYNPNNTTVWWEVAMKELGFNPIPVCWSGSSVTSHEKNTDTRKCSWAWHESQIRKCGIRIAGSMNRIAPDAIIIYRGTNDFSHEPYAKLLDGYFDNVNFNYPTTDENAGDYGYKEGLVLTIKKLRDAYPNAKIFLCTLNVFKRINYSHFPTNNGINTLPQYNNAIREVADFMGCGLIEFDKDGITFENCYSEGYITDSATIPTHPSDKGHKIMGLKAVADLKSQFSKMN